MIEKVRAFLQEWGQALFAKLNLNAKTVCKIVLAVVVVLYIGLFLWDWQKSGRPNLPELRSFALLIGAWAF